MLKLPGQKSKENREKEIYFRFAEKMLILCMRYLGNLMDAEEVMHNGFIKVFDHMGKFEERHEKSFEYWIKKIVVNECLMFLRKRVSFTILSIDEVNEKELKSIEFNNSMDAETYLELINALPVGYKTIFNLYVVEEYPHKEIAEILGITESTSRSQLSKARNLLKRKLVIKKDSQYA